jgi:hypothetical protein
MLVKLEQKGENGKVVGEMFALIKALKLSFEVSKIFVLIESTCRPFRKAV